MATVVASRNEVEDTMQIEAPVTFDSIDKLQEHGVNAADIKKLKDAGIHTIQRYVLGNQRGVLLC